MAIRGRVRDFNKDQGLLRWRPHKSTNGKLVSIRLISSEWDLICTAGHTLGSEPALRQAEEK